MCIACEKYNFSFCGLHIHNKFVSHFQKTQKQVSYTIFQNPFTCLGLWIGQGKVSRNRWLHPQINIPTQYTLQSHVLFKPIPYITGFSEIVPSTTSPIPSLFYCNWFKYIWFKKIIQSFPSIHQVYRDWFIHSTTFSMGSVSTRCGATAQSSGTPLPAAFVPSWGWEAPSFWWSIAAGNRMDHLCVAAA